MAVIRAEDQLREETGDDNPCGPSGQHWIAEPGGLTQFGALIETLPPGSRSSIKHWHSAEDELVHLLDGELVLHEGDMEFLLKPGDSAVFAAGVPVGHCLENRGTAPARYLIVGTRAAADRITYPDHDRVLYRDRSQDTDVWTDKAGNPSQSPYRG